MKLEEVNQRTKAFVLRRIMQMGEEPVKVSLRLASPDL
jgi:hypothetical protein